jgi:S-methylmethionine-dependent homocysteine/selenocysteine methylase
VPSDALCRREHQRFAEALADAGVDLILCETFTHPREALTAVECALSTGLPVWLSLCRGPTEEILCPSAILDTGERAVELGAAAILVNCSPLSIATELLPKMNTLSSRIGCYANVGSPDAQEGWISRGESSAMAYAKAAATWIALGADIVGGCCGTGPDHIKAIADLRDSD